MKSDTHDRVSATLHKAPAYFAVLLVLTCLLLLWHHVGMDHVFELSARSGHKYKANSDAVINGGASAATVRRVGDAIELECILVKQAEWPYCKLQIEIGSAGNGIDLSNFDSVSLDFDLTAPGARKAKLFLLNFDRGWSTLENPVSHKVNEIEAFDVPLNKPVVLPLDILDVANWWKGHANPPLHLSGVRVDNVISVDLATESHAAMGRHVLTVRSIRFHGKLISKNALLTGLVSVWIASAMGCAGLLSATLRRELSASKAQLKLLSEVNRALKLETQQLAGQAHHDPLTGALNREGLRAELMSTSRLMTDPVSIVFLDIDHFKRINDHHGHQVGDEVLRQFVAIVAAKIRSTDRLVRWGGEEFLLLCSMTDVHQAAALAEKLRLSLMHAQWPNGIEVTSSFGVAQHDLNEEISHVIKRADEQLYCAKNNGRNRVSADFQFDAKGIVSGVGKAPTDAGRV